MTTEHDTDPAAGGIRLSQDPAADSVLARSPFALLVGTMLENNHSVEVAYRSPLLIGERLGADPTPAAIAALDAEQFTELLSQPPPVHTRAGRVAKRVHELATHLTEVYDGDATRLWTETATGEELLSRIRALPGFSKTRARILLALLGKQFGITPDGWREAAAPYGEEGVRLSVADITGPDSLREVRATRNQLKVARKANTSSKAGKSSTTSGASTEHQHGDRDGRPGHLLSDQEDTT
jgi:uncharacterized HhH-GPD family protein